MSRAQAAERAIALPRRWAPVADLPAVGAWLLPFALIVVLGFSGGGYDAIVHGQAGLILWWMILVGAVVGSVSVGASRAALAAVVLLAAFAGWTALGLSWTETAERTWAEISRVLTLLGVLVLGVAAQRRVAARHTVNGTACAVVVIAGVAVLSRLRPELFGADQIATIFPGSRNRLAYPLGYWNLLGGLVVMGLPLLLAAGAGARSTALRAAAAAAVPVVALCIFLTVSRGAIGAAVVVLVLFYALAPDRLPKLALLAITALGSLLLCLAADRRDALQSNLGDALARQQGEELLGLTVLVVLGTALVVAGLALADRHAARPAWTRPPPGLAGFLAVLVLLLGLGAAAAAGGGSAVSGSWEEFKQTRDAPGTDLDDAVGRLESVAGGGRYQFWVAATEAQDSARLTGIGPGAFEYWWARESTIDSGFVRDAHSLWLDAWAETGPIGAGLILALFGLALVGGAARALRAQDPEHRLALAAATAGVGGFVAIASLEWAWEMTVLPAAALLLTAVALAGGRERRIDVRTPETSQAPVRRVATAPLAALALASVVAVGIPTATAGDLRDSQREADAGDLPTALQRARSAAATLPDSASAQMQQALVLERSGALIDALPAAVRATEAEPTNWRTWVVRSRLEARTGREPQAVRSYARARALNPRSPIFRRP